MASPVDEEKIDVFVLGNPNYLYTEYISPGKGLESIQEEIHTLRVVVVNEDGQSPEIVGGYMRFPVDALGMGNYRIDRGVDDFAFYMQADFNTGFLSKPCAVYGNRAEPMPLHPDTGYDLSDGFQIEGWDEVVRIAKELSCYLVGNEFIGFDFGITENGPMIMEINTLPGNMGVQWSDRVSMTSANTRLISTERTLRVRGFHRADRGRGFGPRACSVLWRARCHARLRDLHGRDRDVGGKAQDQRFLPDEVSSAASGR